MPPPAPPLPTTAAATASAAAFGHQRRPPRFLFAVLFAIPQIPPLSPPLVHTPSVHQPWASAQTCHRATHTLPTKCVRKIRIIPSGPPVYTLRGA